MTEGDKSFQIRHNPMPIPTEAPNDYTSGAFCIRLSPIWYGIVMGYLDDLSSSRYWDNPSSAQMQQIEEWLGELAAMDCECGIQDIEVRIDAATGKVQYRTNGGNWNDAESSDGSPYTVILGGDTIINNMLSLPDPTDIDKYCSAAWVLARAWSDDLQDSLEIIDALETLTAEALQSAMETLSGLFPPVDVLGGIVEFLHEGLAQVAIDYARENANDVDAIALAAEALACAFIEAAKDNALEQAFLYLDWPNLVPGFDFVSNKPTFVNYKDWIEFIYNSGSGANAGWLICAWGMFMRYATELLTNDDFPLTHWVAAAANSADLRAEENCEACVECRSLIEGEVEYDFFNPRWWLKKGIHNTATGYIESDPVTGEIEVWYSLVRELDDIDDKFDIPRSCPFECVGDITYENFVATNSFNTRLITLINIPTGSTTTGNFSGQQNGYTDFVARSATISSTTDRAAIVLRLTCDPGEVQQLRNLKINVQEAT